jgi:hypothetical protein
MKRIKVKPVTIYDRINKINLLLDLLLKTDVCIVPVSELSSERKQEIKTILSLITAEVEAVNNKKNRF